jgi:hypothetical protein
MPTSGRLITGKAGGKCSKNNYPVCSIYCTVTTDKIIIIRSFSVDDQKNLKNFIGLY